MMNWFSRTVDRVLFPARTIVRGWQTSDTPLSGPSSEYGKPPTQRYRDHRQRMANLRHAAIGTIVRGWQISDTLLSGFELEYNLTWGFFEWSCAVLINTEHVTAKQWIRQQVLRFLQFCNSKLRNVFQMPNSNFWPLLWNATRKI